MNATQLRFSTLMKRFMFSLTAVLTACTALTVFLPRAEAYFTTLDTGELLQPQQYKAAFAPQLILNDFEGLNALGTFDVGINEYSSVRGLLGFGEVDFQMGGFYKFIPFPDTPKQPAIGAQVGALVAHVGGDTQFSLRLHPLISKKLQTEIGDLTPYASLPIGVTARDDDTLTPIQFVVGSELRPLNTKNFSYFVELGVELNDAFSYIAGAVAYRFDEASLRGR